jgi:hypothetical protein
MTGQPPRWLLRVISEPRFAPYLVLANGDSELAKALYMWNTELCEAFFPSLQFLEVGVRNGIHRESMAYFGRPDWWDAAPLHKAGKHSIDVAHNKAARHRATATPDDVVARLPFGFWASLLSRRYDRALWVPALHRSFPYYSGPRRMLQAELAPIVGFRNRVVHHEPVLKDELKDRHTTVYRLLGYLTPEILDEVRRLDRVPDVLARRPGV